MSKAKAIVLALIAALFSIFFATSGQAQTYGLRSAIGTNLASISPWSSEVPFVDVMKFANVWVSGTSSQNRDMQPLDLDENGWVRSLAPGQVARTLTLGQIGGNYPAGQYLVRYKGQGTLKFGLAARVVSQKPGEILLQVTPHNAGILVIIEATNPADYLRDIEITMPGGICEDDPFNHVASPQDCGSRRFLSFADHAKSILFYPVFAERLRAYSVLRFMNWMLGASSENPVTDWSQRPPLSYQTWAKPGGGVPVEVMIALANLVKAHPWFTLPHQSDDAYARNFAQMVNARLDPALRVYVEHSNEVWNAAFKQSGHARTQGAAQNPPIDAMQHHALRSRRLGEIFKGVLGSKRVVAVLGAQASNPWTASRGLDYLKNRYTGAIGIDAVAIAPYFGVIAKPQDAGKYSAMTLDALFTYVRANALPLVADWARNYRTLANTYGLSLIAYEGGQHMVGSRGAERDTTLIDLFHAFNRDPRIKQMYLDYLAAWKKAGGELFVHYTDVGRFRMFGSWGALEYVSQPRAAAPKFDAIQTFIEQNPVWWTQ